MEAIEELPAHPIAESVKMNVVIDETEAVAMEVDVCIKSNGVADSIETGHSESGSLTSQPEAQDNIAAIEQHLQESVPPETSEVDGVAAPEPVDSLATDAELLAAMSETATAVEHLLGNSDPARTQEITEEIIDNHEEIVSHNNDTTIEESIVESDHVDVDTLTFKTEILVENNYNDNSVEPNIPNETVTDERDNTNNLLSDLGQGIELSEVLRSSDTADNAENNNSTAREEVFNKEELLDILQGNDMPPSGNQDTETVDPDAKKILETQIALNQLSRLKHTRRYRKRNSIERKVKNVERTPRKKKDGKITESNDTENLNATKENTYDSENSIIQEDGAKTTEETENVKNESIVNVLVKDWDDDEPLEVEHSQLVDDGDSLDKACDGLEKSLGAAISQEEVVTTAIDASVIKEENVNLNKIDEEGQPQRRLGRVIKKKVIFDPDNPDTFTKGKIVTKIKETHPEKEQTLPKKSKTDEISQRSKSKSPMSKMQWKKPQPKNSSKQNKRLTEVDKLLMDEGAVNMIYQLTPEAPKGRKNMKTKAEFIKKIQSSTPDSKEMKFRERKKEVKLEEGEAKKIVGKQRSSISSSVKSLVAEDFENHSADDSIIYRRHSSSSYSSTCMSPRRLSDVETGGLSSVAKALQQAADSQNTTLEASSADQSTDIFMADVSNTSGNEIINKDDCLSIKEKLNTKLSLALNKRKRDSIKTEKPSKQKKVSKSDEKASLKIENLVGFQHLSISFDQRLAEICVRKTGTSIDVYKQIVKELEEALAFIDTQANISVTLLTSESGMLCSHLDLSPLLDDNMERRTNNAYELAESVRSLLSVVERHSKFLVCGVWGACVDVSLALVALSDVALASEGASFGLSAAPPRPGVAVLTHAQLSRPLVNDLVVFGRQLSAAEALQSGLVSRTLWPDRIADQVRGIARDLASQPMQSVLLKKQLLNLKRRGESETFLSSLEKERDLLIEYWTSVEGQESLRATLNARLNK